LPAFKLVAQVLPRAVAKRRAIMKKRCVSDDYIAEWFSYEPVGFPAGNPQSKELAAR
jgi:hypothetical protein